MGSVIEFKDVPGVARLTSNDWHQGSFSIDLLSRSSFPSPLSTVEQLLFLPGKVGQRSIEKIQMDCEDVSIMRKRRNMRQVAILLSVHWRSHGETDLKTFSIENQKRYGVNHVATPSHFHAEIYE
jgi:hypothetical protein